MNSTVSTESTHKVQYDQIPRRDPRRKQLILKTKLDHPSMENWEIAARADCTPDYVRSVLRTNPITSKPIQAAERASLAPSCPEAAAQNPSWFEKAIETDLAGLRAALELEQRLQQPGRPSTNLLNPSRVRPITQRELQANTSPGNLNSTDAKEIKRSKQWIRNHLSGTKRGGQGFVIMDAHTDKDGNQSSALFDQMPKLCDNHWYSKMFKTIFQKLQAKEAKGDGKRKQAKMTELLDLAALRVKEADVLAKRKSLKTGSASKEEALQTLEQTQIDYVCMKEAADEMCLGYERIRKVVAVPKPFSSCLR